MMTRRVIAAVAVLAVPACSGGCGVLSGADLSSSDAERHAEVLDEIAEEIGRMERGEEVPDAESLRRLREAVESHASSERAEVLVRRIEALGGTLAQVPVPAARVSGAALLVLAAIVALSHRRRPIHRR